jgi:hypothetical protein
LSWECVGVRAALESLQGEENKGTRDGMDRASRSHGKSSRKNRTKHLSSRIPEIRCKQRGFSSPSPYRRGGGGGEALLPLSVQERGPGGEALL